MLTPEQNPSPRLCTLILILITVVGAALRFYNLTYQSLWYDELHTVLRSNPAETISSIIDYSRTSGDVDQPPAFFLLTHFTFTALGYTEDIARVSSALMGILSIVVIYFLSKEFVDRKASLLAAALTAVNYFHIYHSQEARFYTMTFLLSALSYLFLIRAFKSLRLLDFGLYIIFTTLLLYSHYFGMIIFGTQGLTFIILIIFYRRDTPFVVKGILSGIIISLCFLPWLLVVLEDYHQGYFWLKKPSPLFIFDYFYNYFGKDILQVLALLILIFYFVKIYFEKKEVIAPQQKQLFLILLLWLVVSYFVPYIRSVLSTPILVIRYTTISLPAWIIVFAIGWSAIKKQKLKWVLAGVIILSSVINLIFIRHHYTKIQKQQMREVAQFVQAQTKTEAPVFSSIPEYWRFYFPDSAKRVNATTRLDSATVDTFWLLQVEFFSPDECEQELQPYKNTYEVAETHPFYKASAVLLQRKENNK